MTPGGSFLAKVVAGGTCWATGELIVHQIQRQHHDRRLDYHRLGVITGYGMFIDTPISTLWYNTLSGGRVFLPLALLKRPRLLPLIQSAMTFAFLGSAHALAFNATCSMYRNGNPSQWRRDVTGAYFQTMLAESPCMLGEFLLFSFCPKHLQVYMNMGLDVLLSTILCICGTHQEHVVTTHELIQSDCEFVKYLWTMHATMNGYLGANGHEQSFLVVAFGILSGGKDKISVEDFHKYCDARKIQTPDFDENHDGYITLEEFISCLNVDKLDQK